MHKIICIGTCSDIKHNRYTGQSVMFDGMVNHLKKYDVEVSVVDISQKINKEGIFFRSLDYCLILFEILWRLITNIYDFIGHQ